MSKSSSLSRASRLIGAAAGAIAVSGVAIAADVFVDVPVNFWAREYIEWANDNHVMTGPGGQERSFQPNKPVTRAELAAVAFRIDAKIQADIDMLARRIRELENGIGSSSSWSSSSSSRSSVSSSRSSSISSSSSSFTGALPGRLLYVGSLNGSEAGPSINTSARGFVQLWGDGNGLRYHITVSGMSGAIIGGTFSLGNRGQVGTVIRNITFNDNRAAGTWMDLTQDDWSNLQNGMVYADVRSARYPQGEIRGQLIFRR